MRNKHSKIAFVAVFLLAITLVTNFAFAQVVIPRTNGQATTFLGTSNFSPTSLLMQVLAIALSLAGLVAILFVIYGGYRYLTAGGNEDSAEAGKKIITNAIIGLAVIIMSWVILQIIQNALVSGVT